MRPQTALVGGGRLDGRGGAESRFYASSRISSATESAGKCTRIRRFPISEPGPAQADIQLEPGLVLAIEPMVNAGGKATEISSRDHWTVLTCDRRPSVHFEHTVALPAEGPEVLTVLPA